MAQHSVSRLDVLYDVREITLEKRLSCENYLKLRSLELATLAAPAPCLC
jgi:hypothetical protein